MSTIKNAADSHNSNKRANGAVFQNFVAHIEPITRFDRNDIHEASAEEIQLAHVSVELSQSVKISVDSSGGTGHLSGVQEVDSHTKALDEIRKRCDLAVKDVPDAIQRWAASSDGAYMRLMPSNSAFLKPWGAVGVEWQCEKCHGAKRLSCDKCNRVGSVICRSCKEMGHTMCTRCKGMAKITCTKCNGKKSWQETKYTRHWNGSAYVDTSSLYNVYCTACDYAGMQPCPSCSIGGLSRDGSPLGRLRCSSCGGNGRTTCTVCHGKRDVGCVTCKQTGTCYVIHRVAASVGTEVTVQASQVEPEAKSYLESRNPTELLQLGKLVNVTHFVTGQTLRTNHELEVNVRRASISAKGAVVDMFGYGPRTLVYDYKGLAAHLLSEDLETLRSAIDTKNSRRAGTNKITPALANFLRSELNVEIAEAAAVSEGSEEVATAIESKYKGVVSRDYTEKAVKAIQDSFDRIYTAEMSRPARYLGGIAFFIAVVCPYFYWPSEETAWLSGIAVALTAIAFWRLAEAVILKRVGLEFSERLRQRVLLGLTGSKNASYWRKRSVLMIAGSAIVGTGLGWSLQPKAEGAWKEWTSQGPDVSLRRFESKSNLERWARSGNARAQIMLAWYYTVGIGGSPKQPHEGLKQLADVDAVLSDDRVILQAIAVFNRDSTPTHIRSSVEGLRRLAASGNVEARYWYARALLNKQSPVYDTGAGIENLMKAADSGHGHAAFFLGQALAQGDSGLRKDVALAANYLKVAESLGVKAAGEALKSL